MPLSLMVQPKVQKEKWSLYWKESMATKTDDMDVLKLSFEPNVTIEEVRPSPRLPCNQQHPRAILYSRRRQRGTVRQPDQPQ